MDIESPVTPHRKHAAGVAAADEDCILFEHKRSQIARRARKQRQVRRLAVELAETGVETQAPGIGIAMRGADEADFGFAFAGLFEEIIDQQQVVEFERQRRSADGDNLFVHFRQLSALLEMKKESPMDLSGKI